MTERYDVVVIGAGFAGLYSLHMARELGMRTMAVERADGVGGTWLHNRYPGARCDIESVEYSYSFSPEVQAEWTWSELLPAQPEIERYLNFVADRLDLRRDIRFGVYVVAMDYDDGRARWRLRTAAGEEIDTRFVIAATGILSAPLRPDIPGIDTFAGETLFSSSFPRGGHDFAGQRVAIVGTGSSGVQATPVVAEAAEHLYVMQRSAAYTLPSTARPYRPGEFEELRSNYDTIRAAQRESFIGSARASAFSVILDIGTRPPIKDSTPEERPAAIESDGVAGALMWSDVLFDIDANRMATELYGQAVARIVDDPETAAALVPDYPFACKRPIIDQGYYPTFNRPNVTLVDLRREPIETVVPEGIRTLARTIELHAILYATGFDAITGALTRMDIRGRHGMRLADLWSEEGPVSYLGLAVSGFPNLFTIQGPASPSANGNFVTALEDHVEWIRDYLAHLRDGGHTSIEARPGAQAAWMDETLDAVQGSVVLDRSCNSWYNGSNVPGKPRRYLAYAGGIPEYRRRCDAIAADGYSGFEVR